jgi:restriction system protein
VYSVALTEKGETASTEEIEDAPRISEAIYRERRAAALATEEAEASDDSTDGVDSEVQTWKELLIGRLLSMEPAAFERLAQRILREAGFESVRVRGRSGDGGIDGEGVSGTVAAEDIRSFRGAMVGRGDKGLFITTGTFTGPWRTCLQA